MPLIIRREWIVLSLYYQKVGLLVLHIISGVTKSTIQRLTTKTSQVSLVLLPIHISVKIK